MRKGLFKPVRAPLAWAVKGVSGKTSWEWLELLIVPLFLAVGAFYLETRVESRQERIAAERYEQEARIADERAKQETLDNYLAQMQGLLLDRNLRNADGESEVRSVARAITATTIRELGSERNALLTSFLQEAELIQKDDDSEEPVGLMAELDLKRVSLSNADLLDADLLRTDLSYANLREANLHSAKLIGTKLTGADLTEAWLILADLREADLRDTQLKGANLLSADLRDVTGLEETQLEDSHLCKTKLPEAFTIDPDRDCNT